MLNPVGQLRGRFTDKDGNLTPEMSRAMNDWMSRIVRSIDTQNKLIADFISANTKIQGRTEGIGTTASKLTSTGKLDTTDSIEVDGIGSPLTGGKRGFQALDTNNRLASSFNANPLNVSGTPTSASILSNDGASTAITVAASIQQFGPSQVAYNGGMVDPGGFGSFAIYADDPTFAGGTVTYQFSATVADQTANDGRVPFGAITTAFGAAHTGGGYTGGDTPGGGGGRGYNKF